MDKELARMVLKIVGGLSLSLAWLAGMVAVGYDGADLPWSILRVAIIGWLPVSVAAVLFYYAMYGSE